MPLLVPGADQAPEGDLQRGCNTDKSAHSRVHIAGLESLPTFVVDPCVCRCFFLGHLRFNTSCPNALPERFLNSAER